MRFGCDGVMGYLTTALSQIYCYVGWWKNFENRSAFGKLRCKSRVTPFSGHGVYFHFCFEFDATLFPDSRRETSNAGGCTTDVWDWDQNCMDGKCKSDPKTLYSMCQKYVVSLTIAEISTLTHTTPLSHTLNKDQLSLTNPRDALHYGERAANK